MIHINLSVEDSKKGIVSNKREVNLSFFESINSGYPFSTSEKQFKVHQL